MFETKYCPNCFRSHPSEDAFCWECGAELTLEPPLKCYKCSRVLARTDKFCPNCGVKVK